MAGAEGNVLILTSLDIKEEKCSNDSDSTEKYDPSAFCRTCANMDPCLVPIFKGEGLDYSLDQKIKKYLPIQVSEEDDLPVQLCYHCASILIAWDSLILECVEAEKKLISLKNSSKDKEDEAAVEDVEDVIIDSIDSDDEPLSKIIKQEEKRDISQEKTDQILESTEIKSERRGLRRLSERKAHVIVPQGDGDSDSQEECSKPSKCSRRWERAFRARKRPDTRGAVAAANQCPVCHGKFSDAVSFSNDLYAHLVHKVLEGSDAWDSDVCKVCGAKCEDAERLPEHILLHVDAKKPKEKPAEEAAGKLTCELCGKKVSKKYALKRHMETHSREKKFTCDHCGKQYSQESGLQRHVLAIHKGVRRYKCPICGAVLGSNAELRAHQDTHKDPRPFQCDECGKTFTSHKHLYHHRKYHHTANGMRRLCQVCNRSFSSPSVLRRHHKVIHLGLKEFQCHVCSAQLTTKHYLQEHLRLHTDERPEVCRYCGKAFQVSGNLRQHLKTHLGRTQICCVCGRGFTRRCQLKVHMSSHRGMEHPQC